MSRARAFVTVVEPGPLTTVQDSGRPGLACQGIGRSGACDRAAYALGNRLVGNDPRAAALEVTAGGLVMVPDAAVTVALTGARCPGAAPHNGPFPLRAGEVLRLGTPEAGLRTYVALRGGVDVQPVLGSRSTDVLAGLGPAVLSPGDRLPVGGCALAQPVVDVAPVADPVGGAVSVRVQPGPRRDWFTAGAWRHLQRHGFSVTADSNRTGLRLRGPTLQRCDDRELPSEGLVRGAIQVPPSGDPILFLADHPVTGGYPVIAYVVDPDVDRCAQLRPGQTVRFRA